MFSFLNLFGLFRLLATHDKQSKVRTRMRNFEKAKLIPSCVKWFWVVKYWTLIAIVLYYFITYSYAACDAVLAASYLCKDITVITLHSIRVWFGDIELHPLDPRLLYFEPNLNADGAVVKSQQSKILGYLLSLPMSKVKPNPLDDETEFA